MNKCYKCLFAGEYRDMGASTPVCERCADFAEAIKEYEKAEPCKWHITRADIIRLQNEGVIELKPFVPASTPQEKIKEIAKELSPLSKAINDAIEAMGNYISNLAKSIENGGKTE